MPPNSKTHLNRAFDHLDEVIYIMGEVIKGRNAEEIRKHLVEDDPFGNDSREYRSYVAHWLVSDYVKGFSPEALDVFARLMTSDSIETQIKRELLFWKNCERDKLAREITLGPLYRAYHRNDPFFFIEDFINTGVEKVSLAKTTARKCAENYLTIVTKLGFVEYGDNRLLLRYFRPKRESVTAVLYFLFNSKLSPSAILKADDFKYLLLDERDLLSYLAGLNASGLIEFAMAGDVVRLEPKIDFEVLPDALAR